MRKYDFIVQQQIHEILGIMQQIIMRYNSYLSIFIISGSSVSVVPRRRKRRPDHISQVRSALLGHVPISEERKLRIHQVWLKLRTQ